MKCKTGLLFGSFNPVHIGHLIIAEHMLQHTDLTEIWFVLSPRNPLKDNDALPASSRLELLQLAIAGHPGFSVCDIELSMPLPSYTIDTLEELSRRFDDKQFVLLVGSDNMEVFDQWKDYEKLMSRYDIYVYPRPGFALNAPFSHPGVTLINAPVLEISSTHIRQCIEAGKSTRYLLPEEVWQRITQQGYYLRK
jgi:nicotinate-nucleotide adenylyltransferase